MTVTYTDIVDALITARDDGYTVESVVLTEESMETFLADDTLSPETELRLESTLGDDWTMELESGDDNLLRLENGSKIRLE